MGEVTLTVEDGVEKEVALALLGRAERIHENAGDDSEEVALELRDVGQSLYSEHAADAPEGWS